MADLPSTQALIQLEETQFQDSLGESVFTKIGSAINYLLDNSVTNDVGTIIESVLTEEQFQSERNDTWVLMDGRDITGSTLDSTYGISTLPDMTDRFARVMDDGLGTDSGRVIATEQDSQNVSHTHFTNNDADYNGAGTVTASTRVSATYATNGGIGLGSYVGDDSGANTGLMSAQGSDDFKPINITVNYFIKINL